MDLDQMKLYGSVAVAIVVGTAGTIGFLHSEFVSAGDFKTYQQSTELRILEEKKRSIETDKLKLDTKKEVYSRKFDAVDRAVLDKLTKDIREIDQEIKEIRAEQRKR